MYMDFYSHTYTLIYVHKFFFSKVFSSWKVDLCKWVAAGSRVLSLEPLPQNLFERSAPCKLCGPVFPGTLPVRGALVALAWTSSFVLSSGLPQRAPR